MQQVEEFKVSPIEQELSFRAWCQENEIEGILFDGDDTLWQMVPIIRGQTEKCCDLLTQTGIMPKGKWKEEVVRLNDKLFETHGVIPSRWNMLVDMLADIYGLEESVQIETKKILADIYQIPPKFIEGTENGLQFLKKTGMPVGIVTHANEEWTKRKFDWLKLENFFRWDEAFIVDETKHKTIASWEAAMNYFKIKPENCLVVGDSPRADINPVCELGVRHCLLVQNSWEIWSLHKQSVDELKTRGIKSAGDIRWLGKEMVHRK
jgi:FMN phosphatase YigB (HAD superfamily)